MKRTLILGGPGTGKTTRLIEVVERFIEAGVRPNRVAFVSFTRAAAYEARDGACKKFGLTADDLPWFRTLHSTCYRILGLNRGQVFGVKHRAELAELTGESAKEDEPLMALSQRSRTMLRGLQDAWEESPEDAPWFRAKRFHEAYERYRGDRSVYDFTDMLSRYVESDVDGPCPVDIAVVDEAQDLSALQWRVVEKAFANSREVYYAGDDDQQIHQWVGADGEHFHGLFDSVDERVVLPVSHRLPEPVFELSQDVIGRVSHRFPKDIVSAGKAGTLDFLVRPDEVDLSTGSWLLLARCRYQLDDLVRVARDQGVVYAVDGEPSIDVETVLAIKAYEALRRGASMPAQESVRALTALGIKRKLEDGRDYSAIDLGLDVGPIWHDALTEVPLDEREYLLGCLRRGERLDAAPRVRIGTIHSSKGVEADNVLLATDMTRRIADGFRRDPDSELRVWYVGITRASGALYVVQPRTHYGVRL